MLRMVPSRFAGEEWGGMDDAPGQGYEARGRMPGYFMASRGAGRDAVCPS